MLEKTTQVNYLFDFYQALLTPKQRDYLELYYLEDLSLGEISETFDVSRQAVYDNIRRTETMLKKYEEKLKLYDKFTKRQALYDQLTEAVHNQEQEVMLKLVKKLKEID